MKPAPYPLPRMSVVRFVLANMVDFAATGFFHGSDLFPEADLGGFPPGGA